MTQTRKIKSDQKPVLFIDFHNTINFHSAWSLLPEDEYLRANEWIFTYNRPLAHNWMRGMHTSEEINQKISVATDIPYETLWNAFIEGIQVSSIGFEFLEALEAIREACFVILITDNMDSFDRFFMPGKGIDPYFDSIINSYNVGRLKTDLQGKSFCEEIFAKNAEISKSFLIDDNPHNCTVFTELGGTAYNVTESLPTLYWINEVKTVLKTI